jgi:hypothetical protein
LRQISIRETKSDGKKSMRRTFSSAVTAFFVGVGLGSTSFLADAVVSSFFLRRNDTLWIRRKSVRNLLRTKDKAKRLVMVLENNDILVQGLCNADKSFIPSPE